MTPKLTGNSIKKIILSMKDRVEPFEGFISDLKVTIEPLSSKEGNEVHLHIMMDKDAYWTSDPNNPYSGGFHNVMDLEKNIKSVVKYFGVNQVKFHRYINDSKESIDRFEKVIED